MAVIWRWKRCKNDARLSRERFEIEVRTIWDWGENDARSMQNRHDENASWCEGLEIRQRTREKKRSYELVTRSGHSVCRKFGCSRLQSINRLCSMISLRETFSFGHSLFWTQIISEYGERFSRITKGSQRSEREGRQEHKPANVGWVAVEWIRGNKWSERFRVWEFQRFSLMKNLWTIKRIAFSKNHSKTTIFPASIHWADSLKETSKGSTLTLLGCSVRNFLARKWMWSKCFTSFNWTPVAFFEPDLNLDFVRQCLSENAISQMQTSDLHNTIEICLIGQIQPESRVCRFWSSGDSEGYRDSGGPVGSGDIGGSVAL